MNNFKNTTSVTFKELIIPATLDCKS